MLHIIILKLFEMFSSPLHKSSMMRVEETIRMHTDKISFKCEIYNNGRI